MNVLFLVDIQNDFCEGGSLAVGSANEILPVVNEIRMKYSDKFNIIVMTQDYHPYDHISFKESPYLNDTLELDELTNKWKGAFPSHCVQNSEGAEFHKLLILNGEENVFRKGEDKFRESFSGFGNPDLLKFLNQHDIRRIFVTGLAYDFCVRYTALDSSKFGFNTFVIKDACRGISEISMNETETDFKNNGVKIITSDDLDIIFNH